MSVILWGLILTNFVGSVLFTMISPSGSIISCLGRIKFS